MSLPMTWRSAGHHRWNSVQVVGEAGAGDVVDERVVPDVDRAGGRVPGPSGSCELVPSSPDGERDAPGGARAADREVLEALADEAQHLVAPVVGLDEVRVRLVVREQALLVGRQAEEPVALAEPLEGHARVVRALHPGRGLVQVRRRLEALGRAVPAVVAAEVDVAVVVGAADHLLGRAVVVGIGGADEPVRADQQRVLGRREQPDLVVDELAWRHARGSADWAMFTLCSSVPVRNRVSWPCIRCQRATTSAPMTSYTVWRPGALFA